MSHLITTYLILFHHPQYITVMQCAGANVTAYYDNAQHPPPTFHFQTLPIYHIMWIIIFQCHLTDISQIYHLNGIMFHAQLAAQLAGTMGVDKGMISKREQTQCWSSSVCCVWCCILFNSFVSLWKQSESACLSHFVAKSCFVKVTLHFFLFDSFHVGINRMTLGMRHFLRLVLF